MADEYEITWEDVMNTALEEKDGIKELTASQVKLVINEASRRVKEVRFGADTFDARRYLAAHIAMMMIQISAGLGTEGSISIGGVSTSHTMPVNNPTAEQNILSTIYGRQYYELSRSKYIPFYIG